MGPSHSWKGRRKEVGTDLNRAEENKPIRKSRDRKELDIFFPLSLEKVK